eukprot:365718-Chlamydomonas_euryale.AAC.11
MHTRTVAGTHRTAMHTRTVAGTHRTAMHTWTVAGNPPDSHAHTDRCWQPTRQPCTHGPLLAPTGQPRALERRHDERAAGDHSQRMTGGGCHAHSQTAQCGRRKARGIHGPPDPTAPSPVRSGAMWHTPRSTRLSPCR